MGRHTHPDDIDDEPAPPPEVGAGGSVGPAGAVEVAPAPGHKTSAVADLHLIMRSPRLLATCAAVIVAPFVVYFVLIVSLQKTADWALFLGVPMVLAGVLVGAVLDRAYSRLERGAGPSSTVAQDSADERVDDPIADDQIATAAPAR